MRTLAELKKALLSIDDVPSGYTLDPPSPDTGGLGARSKNPRCAPFVRLSNTSKAPGASATVEVSFSKGQDGPAVDESLDAMGSAARVAALQASFKAAIAACHTVDVTVPGAGTAALTVQAVRPPAFGRNPIAAQMTVAGGPLKGMVFTLVTTGIGDTVLSMAFVAAPAADVEAATSVAVDKATQSLGITAGT